MNSEVEELDLLNPLGSVKHIALWCDDTHKAEVLNLEGAVLIFFSQVIKGSCPEIVMRSHFSAPSLPVDEYLGLAVSQCRLT